MKKGIEGIKELDIPLVYKGTYYRKLATNVLKEINRWQDDENKLETLWDKIKIPRSIGAYAKYVRAKAKDEDGREIDDVYENLWRQYQVDETGKMSIFRNKDRHILTQNIINRQIRIHHLKKEKFIKSYFPLNNEWITDGRVRYAADINDPNAT